MKLTVDQTDTLYETTEREHEKRDFCSDHDFHPALAHAINADGGEPPQEWKTIARAAEGDRVVGGGVVLKEIPGAGKVYDWRDSDWTPTNGGRIDLRLFTQHIPVIRNVDGYGDIVTLRNVLVAQDLMVPSCTDDDGNIGLFTPFNYLCYHARGANTVSTGCENMHFSSEAWNKKQLRAMAWVIQLCERKHNVPRTRGRLGTGDGVVRVLEEGQVWHQEVSKAAGFNDRVDPWNDTPRDKVIEYWEYVQFCIRYWEERGSFVGA